MTAEEYSTIDAVQEAVIRRPTGAAARAAGAVRRDDGAAGIVAASPKPVVYEAMRTTLHLRPAMRIALKRRALDLETTMGELIRNAINVGLLDPAGLGRASMGYRGTSGGVRTTLDLPRNVHRTLKRVAAEEETSLQALVVAAIEQTYPDLS